MRPACVRWRAPWFRWAGCEQVDQFPHGRDGHAPFLLRSKVQFQRANGFRRTAVEKINAGFLAVRSHARRAKYYFW